MCTNNTQNCGGCNQDPCGCKTSTDDIVYNGPNLECTGIQTCDTLTTSLQTISEYLCSIDLVQVIINNITNNINLYNQFTTIVNNTVDCQTVWDCINQTTTTTTTIIPPTTTTTTIPITIDCITYLASNGNLYVYDPVTNTSFDLFNDGLTYFNVSNTDTKLFAMVSGGYTREYNLSFAPGPIPTYNRLINTGNDVAPIFAIDNTTLIAWDNINKLITELDITTNTAVSTTKGSIEAGYNVSDGLLTASGKLIIVATNQYNINDARTRIYQYDYSTWTLEIMLDVTDQLPTFLISGKTVRSYIIAISQYQGEIYLFSRVLPCSTVPGVTSRVYNLDLLTNTLVYTGNDTGFTCGNSASSQLICNTVDINPNIIPTTTTTTTSIPIECIAFANTTNRLWITDGSPTDFVEFDSLVDIPQSPSIATTYNKLFVLVNEDNLLQPVRKIYEYDMSYSPNSLTFVRTIDYPAGINSLGTGACAINDTMLIVSVPQCVPDYSVCVTPTPVVRLDISGSVAVIDSTITYLPMFNRTTTGGVPTGNVYSNLLTGDIIYTTNNKIITLDQNSTWPLVSYIHQYDVATGNLEFELVIDTPLSPTTPRLEGSIGIFVFNSNLHLITNTNPITGVGSQSYIYQVDTLAPYTITALGQSSPFLVYSDASNISGCVNISFTPNITPTTTTTTTQAPSGFNTIYTHFEAL